jgi:hypothetical protein
MSAKGTQQHPRQGPLLSGSGDGGGGRDGGGGTGERAASPMGHPQPITGLS